MAEIKDVYSLEFNSSQFQTEINSAIQSIDELNAAMEQGVDVADDLEAAQANLVNILSTEANGVEQLNQKRDTLVKTQKRVNAESKAGVAVGKQLNATNQQIAVSSGKAAAQQRGFGQSLVTGVRSLGQMRRVVSTLGFAFRALTSAIPFGFILALAGPIIEFFSDLIASTNTTAKNMEKINDTTLDYKERLQLAEVELRKLQNIENERGSLTDEEQKKRRELVKVYKETSEEMLKEEQDRLESIADLQYKSQRIAVKLRGDSVEAIKQNLEIERKEIMRQTDKRDLELKIKQEETLKQLREAEFDNEDQKARLLKQKYDMQTEERGALWTYQSQQIIELENETQKKIADLVQKGIDKQKADKLKGIQEEMQNVENALQIEILKTEENTEARLKAEIKLIDILEALKIEYQKELGLSQSEIALMEQENINKRKEFYNAYYKFLESKEGEAAKIIIKVSNKLTGDIKNNLKKLNIDFEKLYKDRNSIIENQLETELNNQLIALEKERNALLNAAKGNKKEEEKINNDFDKRRLILEIENNKKILNEKVNLLNQLRTLAVTTGDEKLVADIDKQISEVQLKLVELDKKSADTTEQLKGLTDKQKELIEQTASLITGVSDSVFSVLNSQVQAYINGLDKAIDKSKSALDEIRANSENYNARQLEIEKERLEKLEAERARAVEREKTLAQVQLAINAAIAISKAAAEGGAAAPVTIALTLASLIAGLAQARVAAGNAFFHGVEYLERGNNKAGRDTIPAMLNEGERVITTDTNNKYWDVLSAVHNNRIPADVLNTFSKAYQQGGIKNALGAFGDNVSLSNELGQKSIFVNVAQTYGGLENRLERIENVLTELPKYMPKTTVSANANGIFKIVEQRQARKNFSRNWSK
jgi:uncharacterized membrane protein (DUF106 family)